MAVNSPEIDFRQLPGTRIVNHNGYIVEMHMGRPYMHYLDAFLEKAVELKAKVFKMEGETAWEIMEKHMRPEGSVKDIEVPSIMFFLTPDSRYIGYATHRMFMIETSEGSIPFVYVTRTIEEGHQGKHLGRFAIQEGLVLHDKAKWLGYRTQSPPAVYATMQAKVFKEGRHFPFEATYDSEGNLLAQQVMMGLYWRIHRHGSTPDLRYGVSIHDYDEENKACVVNPNHEPTLQIGKTMQEKYHMKFRRGDSLYGVGELI